MIRINFKFRLDFKPKKNFKYPEHSKFNNFVYLRKPLANKKTRPGKSKNL